MVFVRPLFVQSLRFKFKAFGRSHTFSLLTPCRQQNGRREETIWSKMCTRLISSAAEVSELECDELHDEVKATEKETALRLALSRLSSDFGKESMLSLQRFFRSRRAPVISTGSLKLDLALGIGGLPKGRIVEIYGREASGKTTLALHVIKEAQKLGEAFDVWVFRIEYDKSPVAPNA